MIFETKYYFSFAERKSDEWANCSLHEQEIHAVRCHDITIFFCFSFLFFFFVSGRRGRRCFWNGNKIRNAANNCEILKNSQYIRPYAYVHDIHIDIYIYIFTSYCKVWYSCIRINRSDGNDEHAIAHVCVCEVQFYSGIMEKYSWNRNTIFKRRSLPNFDIFYLWWDKN